jgi:hypothetical protein
MSDWGKNNITRSSPLPLRPSAPILLYSIQLVQPSPFFINMNLFMKSTDSLSQQYNQATIMYWRRDIVGAILVSVLISLKIKQNITSVTLHAEIIRTDMW